MLYVYLNDDLQIICPVEADNVDIACDLVWDRTKIEVSPSDLIKIATPADMEPVLDRIGKALWGNRGQPSAAKFNNPI